MLDFLKNNRLVAGTLTVGVLSLAAAGYLTLKRAMNTKARSAPAQSNAAPAPIENDAGEESEENRVTDPNEPTPESGKAVRTKSADSAKPRPTTEYPGPCSLEFDAGSDGKVDAKITLTYDGDRLMKSVFESTREPPPGAPPDSGPPSNCYHFVYDGGRIVKTELDQGCTGEPGRTSEVDYAEGANAVTMPMAQIGPAREGVFLVRKGGGAGDVIKGITYRLGSPGAVEWKTRDGLITRATVDENGDGSPDATVTVDYDEEGRLRSVEADLGNDGTTDEFLHMNYDAAGNVTAGRRQMSRDGETRMAHLTANYGCWNED